MNKDQLQQELKEKIKEGIKPSDLKKIKKLPDNTGPDDLPDKNPDEGYESDDEQPKNNKTEALELALQEANSKIRDQKQSLKSLKNKINSNQKIISKLETKINEQDKTIQNLQNQPKNKENDKESPLKETKTQTTQTEIRWQESQEPQKLYLFTCDICEQNKKSKLHLGRVNGLGINPHKQNKICDYCINKVDLITEKDQYWYGNY